jgi:hypothetical protein
MVMAPDAADDAEVPACEVAVTVKVYVVPLESPLTVAKVAPVVVLPPDQVTVYWYTGLLPWLSGAVHITTAVPLAEPTMASTLVGLPGACAAEVKGHNKANAL